MIPPRSEFEGILWTVWASFARRTPGAENLSKEMTLLMGMAMFGDYLLFPSELERQLAAPPYVNPEA